MSNKDIDEIVYCEYFKIIQNTITRMSQNSFLIKAWTVTIIASLTILILSISNIVVLTILIGVVIIFWIFDSNYLKLERHYRSLYEKIVAEYNSEQKSNIKLFDMQVSPLLKVKWAFVKAMISKSELLFYGALEFTLLMFLILVSVL
ncbi:MAG: hypothetical protein ACFFAH_11220 [Promethearchaeota archaeon]